MTEEIENYTDPNFELKISTLSQNNKVRMRRYYHMTVDEVIDMFLPMNFNYQSNADEEYKFKASIFSLEFDALVEILEDEGLYTKTANEIGNVITFGHTYKAKQVERAGGWLKYLKDISDSKERQKNLELTTITNNRVQKYIVILTAIIVLTNLGVDIKNYLLTKESIKLDQSKDNTYIQLHLLQKDILLLKQQCLDEQKKRLDLEQQLKEKNHK